MKTDASHFLVGTEPSLVGRFLDFAIAADTPSKSVISIGDAQESNRAVPKKGTARAKRKPPKPTSPHSRGFAETGSTVFDSSRAVIVHTKLTASVHF